ncbi:MAG: ATP-dependent DNA helicase RecG [Chloroflexi bacterium]|nr:ATP-dependent DNA helicase RecG [Chloroflexota bacterium]
MPSALETLVKILKLEREQGCKDSAVIGGLASFGEKWASDAHAQARKPEHHLLVDELLSIMRNYTTLESKGERLKTVSYMLDRIVGRVPPPPEYQVKDAPPTELPPVEAPKPPAAVEARPPAVPRPEPPRQEKPERSELMARPPQRDRPKRDQPPRPQQPQARPAPVAEVDDEDRDLPVVDEVLGEREASYDSYDAPARPRGDRGRHATEPDIKPLPRLARPPRRPRPQLSPDEAMDILRGLSQPVTVVKGVGPGMAKLLERLGVYTVNDLLLLLPRRHDDYTSQVMISRVVPGQTYTIIGTVIHTDVRAGKNGRKDFFLVLDDGSARMRVTFFGQHYLSRQVRVGQQLVLRGETGIFGNQIQMTNPEWEHLDAENLHTNRIVPVYPLTEGLSARALRKLMRKTVEYWADRLPDYVPEATLERADLADLGWTLKNLHFPEGWDHLDHARNRYIFDQLLLLQLAVLKNRREWQSVPGQPIFVSDEFLQSFIEAVFPYPLTGAQIRAIDDIRRDVGRAIPMNRLLQGDVGSGKTAVAMVALGMALANGKQAALMVPTSILAEQHYQNISAALDNMPGDRRPVVALLTSAISETERESIYRGMADGSIDVVIGTHALIQPGVEFKDLAVAIIDEQHRFGVEQRGALRGKGSNPHLLVMTATPIPRTLALTMYADLDLTIIDEMPPGRIPIKTRVVEPVQRERVWQFVEAELDKGRQAFVVHPLVEASDKIEAPAAVEAYERLKQVFFRYKVGLLHGRMRPAEKEQVMADFATNKFHVLVTTSVAEVGVNIPNASVMVIEGANRFGLAQLHQFRGRVGRGEHPSYCLLLTDTASDEARERLHALEETNDGFRLAEMDWKLRGAGDLVGLRQSGSSRLQLAQEMTPQLVELAQREARTIYEEDADLSQPQHHLLAQRVAMLHNDSADVS